MIFFRTCQKPVSQWSPVQPSLQPLSQFPVVWLHGPSLQCPIHSVEHSKPYNPSSHSVKKPNWYWTRWYKVGIDKLVKISYFVYSKPWPLKNTSHHAEFRCLQLHLSPQAEDWVFETQPRQYWVIKTGNNSSTFVMYLYKCACIIYFFPY